MKRNDVKLIKIAYDAEKQDICVAKQEAWGNGALGLTFNRSVEALEIR